MPICCEPGERYAIVLDGDRGKSPEPTFWCRHLSAREFTATLSIGERVAEEPDADKRLDLLSGVLDLSVVDWSHITDRSGQPMPFNRQTLLHVLSMREAWELWDHILQGNRLGGDDAKKSDSPSPSDTGSTAAGGGPGVAETAPARPAH